MVSDSGTLSGVRQFHHPLARGVLRRKVAESQSSYGVTNSQTIGKYPLRELTTLAKLGYTNQLMVGRPSPSFSSPVSYSP